MACRLVKKIAVKVKGLFLKLKGGAKPKTSSPSRKTSVYSAVKRSPTMSPSPEAARFSAMSSCQGSTVRQVTQEDEDDQLLELPRSASNVEISNIEEYLNRKTGTVVYKPGQKSFDVGQLAAIRESSGSVQG